MKEQWLIHAGFWFGMGMLGSWCVCLLATWFLAKRVIVKKSKPTSADITQIKDKIADEKHFNIGRAWIRTVIEMWEDIR